MVDENDNGNEQDFEAPIWNEDRTAMIRDVGYITDKEFGGTVYEFIYNDTKGEFVMENDTSAIFNFLKRRSIDKVDFMRNNYDEYRKFVSSFEKKYGVRFKMNRINFYNKKTISKKIIYNFVKNIFPLIWKMNSEYDKVYLYFDPLIHVKGMTKALHELRYGLHGCYCGPEPGAKCDERLCFDAESAG